MEIQKQILLTSMKLYHLNKELEKVKEKEKEEKRIEEMKKPVPKPKKLLLENRDSAIKYLENSLNNHYYQGDHELHWVDQMGAEDTMRRLWLWKNMRIDDINNLDDLWYEANCNIYNETTRKEYIFGKDYWSTKNNILRAEVKRNGLKGRIEFEEFKLKIDEERFNDQEHVLLVAKNRYDWAITAPNTYGYESDSIDISDKTSTAFNKASEDLKQALNPELWRNVGLSWIDSNKKHIKYLLKQA